MISNLNLEQAHAYNGCMPKHRKSVSKRSSSTVYPVILHWKWILLFSVIIGLFLTLLSSMWSMNKWGYLYPTAQQLSSIVATYRGRQPCADCPGIDAILTLNSDNTYVQKYVYLERNNTSEEKGTWSVVVGTPKDAKAQLVQLTSMGNGTKMYYLISDNQLVPLDSDRNALPSPYNAPLTRQ